MLPVIATKTSCGEMLYNLVDNAIKYTSRGGSGISLENSQREGAVLLKVRDTALELPQRISPTSLSAFTGGGHRPPMAVPGERIGAIDSETIAEAHGGTIGVSSSWERHNFLG